MILGQGEITEDIYIHLIKLLERSGSNHDAGIKS